jgi:hypothetical protein
MVFLGDGFITTIDSVDKDCKQLQPSKAVEFQIMVNGLQQDLQQWSATGTMDR